MREYVDWWPPFLERRTSPIYRNFQAKSGWVSYPLRKNILDMRRARFLCTWSGNLACGFRKILIVWEPPQSIYLAAPTCPLWLNPPVVPSQNSQLAGHAAWDDQGIISRAFGQKGWLFSHPYSSPWAHLFTKDICGPNAALNNSVLARFKSPISSTGWLLTTPSHRWGIQNNLELVPISLAQKPVPLAFVIGQLGLSFEAFFKSLLASSNFLLSKYWHEIYNSCQRTMI